MKCIQDYPESLMAKYDHQSLLLVGITLIWFEKYFREENIMCIHIIFLCLALFTKYTDTTL